MTSLTKRIYIGAAAAFVLTAGSAAAIYTMEHFSTIRTVAGALQDASMAVVHAAGQDTAPPFGGRGRGGPGRFGGPGGPGPGGPGPGGPGGPAGIAMLGRLGLSDAQKDQVKSIMQSHQDEQKGLRDREMSAREALNAAVTADVMDEGAIRARAAELSAIEADMAVAQARIKSEVFQILTPDQQNQAKQSQAQMKQRQEEMKQRMEQRRQGRGAAAPPAQ